MERITIRHTQKTVFIDYTTDTFSKGVAGHTSVLPVELPGVYDVLRLLEFKRVEGTEEEEVYERKR